MSRSVPARCGSGSCEGVSKLRGEVGRRQLAEARMQANFIELFALGFDGRQAPKTS